MFKKILGLVFIFGLMGCGSQSNSSNLLGLADSGTGKNAVVLFGAPHNLAGVPTDIREMEKIFKENSYGFNFQTVNVNGDATVQQILDLSKSTAVEADTMFWYFSGHGNTGSLLAKDKSFKFKQVAEAIKAGRENQPLKRLIVMLDSCYSGSFVDGNAPIIDEEGTVVTKEEMAANVLYSLTEKDASLYEQAFVFTSSTKNQSSLDDGAANGGAFTYMLREQLKELKKINPEVSIQKWAEATREATEKKYKHRPVWKAFPGTVLDEKLFIYE